MTYVKTVVRLNWLYFCINMIKSRCYWGWTCSTCPIHFRRQNWQMLPPITSSKRRHVHALWILLGEWRDVLQFIRNVRTTIHVRAGCKCIAFMPNEFFRFHRIISYDENRWCDCAVCIMQMIMIHWQVSSATTLWREWTNIFSLSVDTYLIFVRRYSILSSVPIENHRGQEIFTEGLIHDTHREWVPWIGLSSNPGVSF